jgi:hypothetical protein
MCFTQEAKSIASLVIQASHCEEIHAMMTTDAMVRRSIASAALRQIDKKNSKLTKEANRAASVYFPNSRPIRPGRFTSSS